jgi:MOSC domain-containing protein YiiM
MEKIKQPTAKLIEIKCFSEKGVTYSVKCATLRAGGGLQNDRYSHQEERAISLLDGNVKDIVDKMPIKGFCAAKFTANLTTSGIDYSILEKGSLLHIGSATIRIDNVGKRCFPECPVEEKADCPLRTHCAFGTSLTDGVINLHDNIDCEKARNIRTCDDAAISPHDNIDCQNL